MKMDRDTYEECWGELEEAFNGLSAFGHSFPEQSVTDALNNLLARLNIEVPPKSVLPGVTKGNWYPVEETGNSYLIRGYDDIAYSIENLADAVLLAGSKKVVEAGVELIVERFKGGLDSIPETCPLNRKLALACIEAGAKIWTG